MTRRPTGLSLEIQQVVCELFRRFWEKFGREPSPNDPVFFGPDADHPNPLPSEKIEHT